MLRGGGGHPQNRAPLSFGFTLAEVLITITLIGIVVAMTLPAIIQKQHEREWLTAYLRVYSILENAYMLTKAENGTFYSWAGCTISIDEDGKLERSKSDGLSLYNTMIKPYIKTNTVYLTLKSWSDSNCWSEKSYDLAGDDASQDNSHRTPAVSLMSGECIILGHPHADFMVDVNSKKGPNVIGKDQFLFSFDIMNYNRIKPGFYENWWTDTPQYCHSSKNAAESGWLPGSSCGFWILRNHNMDYLHMPYEKLRESWNGNVW